MASIPDNTKIQSVDLTVRNLEDFLNFYSGLLGFKEINRKENSSYLSATGEEPYSIGLHENKSAISPPKNSTGLFHTAFRFPNRKELARVFMRLHERGTKFQGFSDHLVSEAIYLADPDSNGVELYADKPREEWQWKLGQIQMDTLPLNLRVLSTELENENDESRGIHPDTGIGHIHLKVSNLFKAEQFYSHILGFNVTNSSYPGALFFAADSYHHHIGTNIWSSRNGSPPPENSPGLINFTIKIPDKEYINSLEKELRDSGLETSKQNNEKILVRDFDNNKIILTL